MRLSSVVLAGLFAVSGPAFAQAPPAEAEPAVEAAPVAAPVTYKLGSGMLVVKVFKDESTLASDLSHNHAIKATGWSGSFTWDPVDQTCAISATVPVAKLDADATATRKWAGVSGEIDDGQREEIKGNLLKPDQLNGAKYPNITFKADSCALAGDTLNVKGSITIRGKAKAVSIPFKGFAADGSSVKGKGSFKVNHTDFGFEPFSALFGALKNLNSMEFVVELAGKAG